MKDCPGAATHDFTVSEVVEPGWSARLLDSVLGEFSSSYGIVILASAAVASLTVALGVRAPFAVTVPDQGRATVGPALLAALAP